MQISIFGLGYVGCVSAGCLSSVGHSVIGVDVDKNKVNLINDGKPTIIEKDIERLIEESRNNGKLEATDDVSYAVKNSDISILCVGTPINEAGELNLTYIYKVAEQIGNALRDKNTFHVVVVRSTVKPGTYNELARIINEKSGKSLNMGFAIVMNPEFLREGSAVNDYNNPPYTLLGSESERALDLVKGLYSHISAPVYTVKPSVAEIIKYINNSFHALKVTFANEVGNICKSIDIDSHIVMDLICKDTKLNISPYYLKPGSAYGGSCLPKDLKALVTLSKSYNVDIPVLGNIERSNELHKERILKEILKHDNKKIGVLGLSFKAGTDDLRESPMIELVERLIGKGFTVKIHDDNVRLSKLMGSNKSYLESKLPHVVNLLADLEETIEESDILVIANKEKTYNSIFNDSSASDSEENGNLLKKLGLKDKIVIDLVRITENPNFEGNYNGISW